jgi:hypothetical protein
VPAGDPRSRHCRRDPAPPICFTASVVGPGVYDSSDSAGKSPRNEYTTAHRELRV